MLSTQSRNNEDLRTIGGLFFNCCDELQDIQFFEAIQVILELLKNALQENFSLTKAYKSNSISKYMLGVFIS